MKRITRRDMLTAGSAAVAASALPLRAPAQDRTVLNDASRLNPTPVFRHWIAREDDEETLVETLRSELKEAAAARRPVAIGAARHSMGGQSLARDGTAISLNINRVELNTSDRTYDVSAGTRWNHVIRTLDPAGFSPAVMQSNNDFGVAATFSVNAHGWPTPFGPMGATVKRIEMMLADGSVVSCSRRDNPELFRLAMGGYGLFGIILRLECEMVENVLLRPSHEVGSSKGFGPRFIAAATHPDTRMAYGRLSVAKSGFLEESLLVAYRPEPRGDKPLPKPGAGGLVASVSREIYRAQVGSEVAKKARWLAETVAGPKAGSGIATRNTLMNEPVANLASRDKKRTDILHEYFVPAERFDEFVSACQELIPKSRQELLNITLRYVAADADSMMAFAPGPRIAGVMSFAQLLSPEAEADMLRLTEALIDRVAALGGAFYLPYRTHARRDQVTRIYAYSEAFAARKRHYDPGLLFRNGLWNAYFA
jgi:FAD/FMN-containing dehydrogenase